MINPRDLPPIQGVSEKQAALAETMRTRRRRPLHEALEMRPNLRHPTIREAKERIAQELDTNATPEFWLDVVTDSGMRGLLDVAGYIRRRDAKNQQPL